MRTNYSLRYLCWAAGLLLLAGAGCTMPAAEGEAWELPSPGRATPTAFGPAPTAVVVQSTAVVIPEYTPTPDPPHDVPGLRDEPEEYYVQPGDTLMNIARAYNVTIEQIMAINDLLNPDILSVGQLIYIPVPEPLATGPDFKIIPDSELVYGPNGADFDIETFILNQGGYLSTYLEEIGDEYLTGAQIITRLSRAYSVNPRLLLAILDHQSGWVSNPNPTGSALDYPMGLINPSRQGLYLQVGWAADTLNRGYYMWRVDGLPAHTLFDGSIIPVAPTLNAGSVAVQYYFAQLHDLGEWSQHVGENGLIATYSRFFGYPFHLAYEPLVPAGLSQPEMQLPFEKEVVWSYTGGPHGGWDSGSAWAALDFAPPGEALGCVQSNAWVVAAADGLIVRTGQGQVIQDLDGDGLEQTGWVILYMHIETRDRVATGTQVKAGDRIGHPSCEGGISTGTHLHIARKYNGEWIPADREEIPFIMDGWVSQGTGFYYDGFLIKGSLIIEAENGREDKNAISR